MTRLLRHFLPIVSAGLLLALPAAAQNAPSTPTPGGGGMQGGMPMQGGPGGPGGPPQKPKNLKVLPENTDLRKVMRGFTAALGVECSYCHAPADPVTHHADRASDANPMKDQARVMIRMVDDLNSKYLPLLAKTPGHDEDKAVIGCGTCHRGEKHPPAFVPPPRPEGEGRPGGAPAGAPPTNPS
jgi:hypothetical protein